MGELTRTDDPAATTARAAAPTAPAATAGSADPYEDMRARWAPDPAAVAVAVAALNAADPDGAADLIAAIPMVQPGKRPGIWTVGQQVETVHGVVFLGRNRFGGEGPFPSYSIARDAASRVAQSALGDREGTVGWASVEPDGHWAMFED